MESNAIKEMQNKEKKEIVTDEKLKELFPSTNGDTEEKYFGKCKYCNVEVNFSDKEQVKIVESKEKDKKFVLYHNGCYDRYIRKTID